MNRIHSPSAERNREPILEVLRTLLPVRGLALEIASGSGQHVVHFARACPILEFQPTEPDPRARASVDAWVLHEALENVRPSLDLDVLAETQWPVTRAEAVICINMIHISPWEATVRLLRGAASILTAGGLLYLYGPYRRGGAHTAPSNAEFDIWLRSQNPDWAVRDLETVMAEAKGCGFTFESVVEMPANNLSVAFRR